MANINSENPPPPTTGRWRKLPRARRPIQLAFLVVWLAPLSKSLGKIPGCVFHCYACPLASFACPIGVVANYAQWHAVPFMAIGVLLLTAAAAGSLVCGWACPFGLVQDILAKLRTPKFRLPNWTSHGRYVVLVVAVLLVPYFVGEDSPLFICRICPAGALESRLPRFLMDPLSRGTVAATDDIEAETEDGAAKTDSSDVPPEETADGPAVLDASTEDAAAEIPDVDAEAAKPRTIPASGVAAEDGTVKWIILAVFLGAAAVTYRPWCKVFCPLGGFLSLFNRFSLFHLRFNKSDCTECNTCRSRCAIGVKVDKTVNNSRCIRCLECVSCGAIVPSLAKFHKEPAPDEG